MPWNPNQREREPRHSYSANNPPPNRETAEQKANDLKEKISLIEIDLEEREVESFSDEAAYEDWRKRALRALVHIKAEARFLEEWLLLQKKKDALQAFVDRIAGLTNDAQTRTNDLRHRPTNLEEARRRLQSLLSLRDELGAEYARLMDLGREAGLTKREATEKLSSLRVLTEAIETERRSTKNYIAVNEGHSRPEAEEEALSVPAQQILDFARTSAAALVPERPEMSGPGNAPSDLSDAKTRRAKLSAFLGNITRCLQTVAEMWRDHVYTGETLKAVNRPLVALNVSVNEEIQYLDGCIEEFHRQATERQQEVRKEQEAAAAAKKTADANRYDELQRTSQRIRKRAEELATEIKGSYSALYNAERPPTDLDEAWQRQAIATEVKLRLQTAFAEITDTWCQHPLSRKELTGVKRPLTDINALIEQELRIAKRFIADRTQQPPPERRRFWKSICVAALTRAAFEGFKLTDEERAVIQELIADIGGKP